MYKRLMAIALSLALMLSLTIMAVLAEETEYGENGRDARSETMSVEPADIDDADVELVDDSEAAVEEDNKEEEKGGFKMDSRILAAMIAAGVTIVVCEFIKSKMNK